VGGGGWCGPVGERWGGGGGLCFLWVRVVVVGVSLWARGVVVALVGGQGLGEADRRRALSACVCARAMLGELAGGWALWGLCVKLMACFCGVLSVSFSLVMTFAASWGFFWANCLVGTEFPCWVGFVRGSVDCRVRASS